MSDALCTRDWLPLSLRYIGLGQEKFPLIARFRDGRSFEFRDLPDIATWWQIFCRNIYPVQSDDRVIIDAGANVGAFTLYALNRSRSAKVIAIEPFPETFSRLKAAVEQSPFRDRVELVNAAVSSHSGSVFMQSGQIGSQFRRVLSERFSENGTLVRSCTLSEILERINGEIDFLKMDIEGSEYASILTTAVETLRRIRRVTLEFHPLDGPDASQPRNLVQRFEEAGFRAIEVQDHGEGYGIAHFQRNVTAVREKASAAWN